MKKNTFKTFAFFILFLANEKTFAQPTFSTVPPLAGGNGANGITFNLHTSQTIVVQEVWGTFYGTVSGACSLWYRVDSINGSPNISTANGWQLLEVVTLTPANTGFTGPGLIMQPIPLTTPLFMPAGTTHGFHMTYTNCVYTTYSSGQALFSDGVIHINTGNNVGYGGGAPNPPNHPRQFNGGIKYLLGNRAPNDAGLTTMEVPTNFCGDQFQDIKVRLKNFGTNVLNFATVVWEINGQAQTQYTFTGMLDTIGGTGPNDTLLTLGSYFFTGATLYDITAWSVFPNGALDTVNNNDTVSVSFTTNPAPQSTFPYFENFENGAGGWTSGGTSSSWALGTPSGSVINTAGSGVNSWMTGLSSLYNNNEFSYVMSPCFNMSSLTNPKIEMKVWWNIERSWDAAAFQSSTDGGSTWQTIGVLNDPGGENWYNNNTLNAAAVSTFFGGNTNTWSGRNSSSNGSGTWVSAKNSLAGLVGQSSVFFRIAFATDGSVQDDGFAFDDILIGDPTAVDVSVARLVAPGSGCNLTSTTTVTAMVKNQGSTAQSNIPVSYRINGGFPVSEFINGPLAPGDSIAYSFITTGDFTATGLGNYIVDVWTSLTGDAIPANDSLLGVVVTNIPPNVSPFPYFENFENGQGGWVSGGVNNSWALGTPSGSVINTAGSGINSWVTNLSGTHNNNEASFVVSPCFNLGSLVDPSIEFKTWWTTEVNFDGAQLQSSIDGGLTWQRVGVANDPLGQNWYNSASFSGTALSTYLNGQNGIWTGNATSGATQTSGGWVDSKNSLTGLLGQTSVIFRFVFGSDGSVLYEGFAFDDFSVSDGPLGVSENVIAGDGVYYYPNPAKESLKIRINNSAFDGNSIVSITDLQGRQVYSSQLQSMTNREGVQIEVNTTEFARGVYFVKLSSQKGVVTQKIILE